MVFDVFRSGHNLRYGTPKRVPPDPTLFPFYIQNQQGLWLRYTEWWPRIPTADIKGLVFIVSGMGEYTGRYDSVALRFNEAGYVVFSVDNQGAGGSEGVRLYVERFSHFVDDIQFFVHTIHLKYPELTSLPRFLLGHSLGGLIATHVAQRDPELFAGVILSGPALQNDAWVLKLPVARLLVRFLSWFVPKLPVFGLNLRFISHSAPVLDLAFQDPFYIRQMIPARTTGELLQAQDEAFSRVTESTFPLLIVHGEDDKLCALKGSKSFLEQAASKDKQLISYPGEYHEVLTGICRKQVMDDVMNFVIKHTA